MSFLPSQLTNFTLAFNWPAALVMIVVLVTIVVIVLVLFLGLTPSEKSMILNALGELIHGPGRSGPTELP